MTSKLKDALLNIKPLFVGNWKYIAAFSLGSVTAFALAFRFAYKLSGYENPKQFMFAIYMKKGSQQFRNSSKWRLSHYIPIRPSNELLFWDELYFKFVKSGGDEAQQNKYLAKPIKERVEHFKSITCPKSVYDINRMGLPFGPNAQKIDKYIKEIKINNFRSLQINWPGTEGTDTNKKRNIVMMFHGGSCLGGAPEMFRPFCVLLSKLTNSTCFSVGYGLAPEYISPVHTDHAIEAYQEILGKYEGNVNKIFIGGHSAGAGMAMLALQKMMKLKDTISRQPDGAIIISGNMDRSYEGGSFNTNKDRDVAVCKEIIYDLEQVVVGNLDMNGNWKDKEQQIDLKDPILSPLYAEVTGLCDLYFHVGANEVLLSQNQEMVDKCLKNGVNVEYELNPWLPHYGPLLCDTVPEARDCCVRIAQWINKRL